MPIRLAAVWTWKYTLIYLCASSCIAFLFWYGYSPRQQAQHTFTQLEQQSISQLDPDLRQAIRVALTHRSSPPTPDWDGTGQHYLHKVWPTVKQQIEPQTLFLLQVSQYLADSQHIKQGYLDFPHTYALSVGKPAITFVWHRQGWWTWHIQYVCSDTPQPVVTLKQCPSAKR
jgi:hypothetical protein